MFLAIKKIVFDKGFEKKFIKYKKRLTEKEKGKLRQNFEIFKNNPFDSRIKTYKLKAELKDYWSFRISYSDRIIFRFIDNHTVFFIDIGDHNIY